MDDPTPTHDSTPQTCSHDGPYCTLTVEVTDIGQMMHGMTIRPCPVCLEAILTAWEDAVDALILRRESSRDGARTRARWAAAGLPPSVAERRPGPDPTMSPVTRT